MPPAPPADSTHAAPDEADAHRAAAAAAFERLFVALPLADGYRLSAAETEARALPKVSDSLDLTYGDVRFDALSRALAAAAPAEGGVFYDLGSGTGRGVLAAALQFPLARAVGVEYLAALHEAALGPAAAYEALRAELPSVGPGARGGLCPDRMAARVELLCSDLFAVEVGQADVVFACCVTWGEGIMARLAAKLAAELAEGARVVTVGRTMPPVVDLGRRGAVTFEEVWRAFEPLEWGSEAFVVHRVGRMGELAARRYRKSRR